MPARTIAVTVFVIATGAAGSTGCSDPQLSLSCPTQLTIIQPRPDAPVVIEVPANDARGAVTFTSEPPITTPGPHHVAVTGTDEAGQIASCELDVDVVPAFAAHDARVISATVTGGATSPVLAWDPFPHTASEGMRLETAADPSGPWQEMAQVATDQHTAQLPAITSGRAWYRLVTIAPGGGDGGITEPVAVYAVTNHAYNLSNVAIPGIGFATSLYGVVRAPDVAEPKPLVIFLHGNHANCVSNGQEFCDITNSHECSGQPVGNAEGYLYLLDTLAAKGFVTVTISGNAINCRGDGIPERTALIMGHLRKWQEFASTTPPAPFGDGRFSGRIDFSQIHAVGHSRGGEGVSALPTALANNPISGLALASVVSVAPTDFHNPAPSGVHFAVVLPQCDGDVNTLPGKGHYDRALGDTSHIQAQWYIPGANHNFFNTTWVDDDTAFISPKCQVGNALRLRSAEQRAILEDLLGRWLVATSSGGALGSDLTVESPLLASTTAWVGRQLTPRMSFESPGRHVIDRFTDPQTTNDLGQANEFVGVANPLTIGQGVDGRFFDDANFGLSAIRIGLDGPVAGDRATFQLGGLDLSQRRSIAMRVAARYASIDPINADGRPIEFVLRVADTAGQTVDIASSELTTIEAPNHDYIETEILQTVRLPIATLKARAPTLDVTKLASLSIVGPTAIGGSSFWLADLVSD